MNRWVEILNTSEKSAVLEEYFPKEVPELFLETDTAEHSCSKRHV